MISGTTPRIQPEACTKIGLVQISELVWERRASQDYYIEGHVLRPNAMGAAGESASLAYLPHSAGLLQAYVEQNDALAGAVQFCSPIYKRMPIAQAVDHLSGCDVVGFSAYVWNVQLSLAIAKALKAARPDVLILFGGPQVPNHPERFLQAHRYVDLVCHGEGERTFLDILDHRHDWHGVQSISYLGDDGTCRSNPKRERIQNLDEIPSPLLEGCYEQLMTENPNQRWLLTWETNRGCPFSCTFCDWGSATASKVVRYSMERIQAEITWMVEHDIHHLVVCDANFGMFERDVEIATSLAEEYRRRNSYLAVSVQNTKNRTDRSEQIQRIFRDTKVISFGASISLQSVDPNVLSAVRRANISSTAFERLQRLYAAEGLETYTDLILALPGESYDSFASGIDHVIRNGQFNRIAFYDCTVLPNAQMAEPAYRDLHAIETVPVRILHAYARIADLERDEAPETIDVVVSTRAMSRQQWIQTHAFADLSELLFFDRLLHVPMLILGQIYGVSYRSMLEQFLHADPDTHPLIAWCVEQLKERARRLQSGQSPYFAAPDYLGVLWPRDQYLLIFIAREDRLSQFYQESASLLRASIEDSDVPFQVVQAALKLNEALLAVPFRWNDELLDLDYSVASAYQALLQGQAATIDRRAETALVERTKKIWVKWDDWYEELIRRIYLRKNYLHPMKVMPVAAPSLELVPKG